MKRALIIHGWESNPNEHWYQEEKQLLEELGYVVTVPEMPDSTHPKLTDWVNVINAFSPDEETVLIGHSLGAPTILRYLERAKMRVGRVFLVAGFAVSLGYPDTNDFVDQPFDWETIKQNAKSFVVLNQKDDPWVKPERGQEIADGLAVKMTLVEGNNHFDVMDLNLINRELK